MNKKKLENRKSQDLELDKAFEYVRTLDDEAKEWLLFVMLGGREQDFSFDQVRGKLLKFLYLLNMFMEYQSLRVNMPDTKDEIAFEIWKDSMEEAPQVFREDIYSWIQENFPRSLEFNLHAVLSKNSKQLKNIEHLEILLAHARKIAKNIENKEAEKFYNLKSVKSIADKFLVV